MLLLSSGQAHDSTAQCQHYEYNRTRQGTAFETPCYVLHELMLRKLLMPSHGLWDMSINEILPAYHLPQQRLRLLNASKHTRKPGMHAANWRVRKLFKCAEI